LLEILGCSLLQLLELGLRELEEGLVVRGQSVGGEGLHRVTERRPAGLQCGNLRRVVRAHREPRGTRAGNEPDEKSDDHGAQDHRPGVGRTKKCWPRRTRKSIGTSTRRLTGPPNASQACARKESRCLRTFPAAATG